MQPELAGGWGTVKFGYANTTYRKDFAEFIPGIYGTYNVTKYFRFGVGLNYRITAGASTQGLKDADVSGLGGCLFIKVGTFLKGAPRTRLKTRSAVSEAAKTRIGNSNTNRTFLNAVQTRRLRVPKIQATFGVSNH